MGFSIGSGDIAIHANQAIVWQGRRRVNRRRIFYFQGNKALICLADQQGKMCQCLRAEVDGGVEKADPRAS